MLLLFNKSLRDFALKNTVMKAKRYFLGREVMSFHTPAFALLSKTGVYLNCTPHQEKYILYYQYYDNIIKNIASKRIRDSTITELMTNQNIGLSYIKDVFNTKEVVSLEKLETKKGY